ARTAAAGCLLQHRRLALNVARSDRASARVVASRRRQYRQRGAVPVGGVGWKLEGVRLETRRQPRADAENRAFTGSGSGDGLGPGLARAIALCVTTPGSLANDTRCR